MTRVEMTRQKTAAKTARKNVRQCGSRKPAAPTGTAQPGDGSTELFWSMLQYADDADASWCVPLLVGFGWLAGGVEVVDNEDILSTALNAARVSTGQRWPEFVEIVEDFARLQEAKQDRKHRR